MVVGSYLAFLRCLGIDRLVSTELTRNERAAYLSLLSLSFLVAGHLAQSLVHYRLHQYINYNTLVHYGYERPLHSCDRMRRIVRRQFDRLMFNAFLRQRPPHKYRKLSEVNSDIRIVKLHAGNPWDIIKASFITVSIYQAPPFEAISYRWSTENQIPILLDEKRFSVPGPVHEMLLALRFRTEHRLLWIDSLCINQTDHAEKSSQIGLMRKIYQSASQVICWLRVDSAAPLLPSSLSALKKLAKSDVTDDNWVDSFASGYLQAEFRSAVSLFCNDVFFRIWIIQEVALARKLVIKLGQEDISLEDLVRTSESFMLTFSTIGKIMASRVPLNIFTRMTTALRNLQTMKELRSCIQSEEKLAIGDLLLHSTAFEVSDPRDRLYGLLGLSNTEWIKEPLLEVNYQDATEAMVSLNATKFTLLNESSFRLLELAGVGYTSRVVEKPSIRPSWVPQWAQCHIEHTKSLVLTANSLYKITTYTPAVITARKDDPRVLQIQGIYVGEIKRMSPRWDQLLVNSTGENQGTQTLLDMCAGLLNIIENACSMALEASNSAYDGERESLVWRTICHHSQRILDDEEDGREITEAIRELRQLSRLGRAVENLLNTTKLISNMYKLMYRMFPTTDKRLCITSEGYFGIVPPYSQEGDQIWAFSGAPNPFLLRRSTDSSIVSDEMDMYELVGACYIHGIMNGELEQMRLEPVIVGLI
ncbi:heterokaryon incompatibility protein-domain-containing protein [Lophiotrema nucula]|uniref:Heterokaryon incompatibility protein-domain-containing protein n=1 Tax=Lophiotrema nucula TaxID=690887 RepID=A0A6A5ZET8_9PLEO|nr:heterokaryon incompatibility protein-domain-containing protein [Lophiotrema nucula]